MPDDQVDPSSSTAPAPRQKQHRSSTAAGTVRSRTSPPPGEQDPRPPTKRARKAINCEPCRNSKLKCDRNRPCSSCVLRGTIALCYQDARGHESELHMRPDDQNASRVDPMQEITRLKHSVSLLETYVLANHRPSNGALPSHLKRNIIDPSSSSSSPVNTKREPADSDSLDKDNAPGIMLRSNGQHGLYAGATSAVTHLTMNDSRQSEDADRHPSQEDSLSDEITSNEYDRDLIALLPSLETIDGLISYYFEYCNWIYRHVNQPAFLSAWSRFKTGAYADRVVLATVCMIMAIAVHYLPPGDPLIAHLSETHEDLSRKFYDIMRSALDRHRAEHKTYSLELVECLLIRCHYLTLQKTDSEEIWSVRGEIISIGMAMGLHRDPIKWRMSKEMAERRRWAWWHAILLERWQAFMFGRPLAIASHHFDTHLPAASDPVHHPSEPRLYLPNIALFRLAYILGDIMDSAVSLRPVTYETVQANDRALTQWMETLPPELDLDEFRVARSLASPDTVTRRLGVQSVIIRTSYYHIRFTLHRPYASSLTSNIVPKDGEKEASKDAGNKDPKADRHALSLDIAVGSADKLITLVGQARPDFLANASLAVPGHMSWGPFHVFSAAMFFSFQLIANPDQPGASLFRANIQKALATLELSRGAPVADKALDILRALAPLYSSDFASEDERERERLKGRVLSLVKTLAFPYHDSPKYPRMNAVDSPNAPGYLSSPGTGNSGSPHGARGSVDYGTTSGRPASGHAASSSLVGYAPGPSRPSIPHVSPAQGMPNSAMVDPSVSPPIAYPLSGPQPSQGQAPPIYGDASRSGYAADPTRHSYSDATRPSGSGYPGDARTTTTTANAGGPPYSDSYPTRHPHSYPDPSPAPASTGTAPPPPPTSSSSSSRHHYVDRPSYADSRQPYNMASGGDPNGPAGRYPYAYPASVEDETMWGASLSQAEWVRFLDAMQRPGGDR
ncbi:fungal-specific transcription factor domain-containing protein [Phlebopus sp. FC_14]|nr:fungal-specific transcription factor domain-containing protein [Phlebopus sp. FC_14]